MALLLVKDNESWPLARPGNLAAAAITSPSRPTAVTRSLNWKVADRDTISGDGIIVNPSQHWVWMNDAPVKLSKGKLTMLAALVRSASRIWPRSVIGCASMISSPR